MPSNNDWNADYDALHKEPLSASTHLSYNTFNIERGAQRGCNGDNSLEKSALLSFSSLTAAQNQGGTMNNSGFHENVENSTWLKVKDNVITMWNTLGDVYAARGGMLLAWLSMGLGVLAYSAIGPMLKFVERQGVGSLVAASWRNQSMLVFIAPLALLEYHWMSPEQRRMYDLTARRPDLDYPVGVYVLIAGLGWATCLLTWATALQYTSTVRASILTSLHTLFLVLYIYLSGGAVSVYEWLGVAVMLVGIVVIGADKLFESSEAAQAETISPATMMFGDCLCLVSSLAQAVVIVNRKKTQKYVALMQYTFYTTATLVVVGAPAAMLLDGASAVGYLDDNSLLGWISPHWLLTMLFFGLVVGVICTCGFNYAAAHISPLVFSAMILMDPVLTGIISWMARLEGIPALTVWLGGLTIMAGVGLLTYGEHSREKSSDVGEPLDAQYTEPMSDEERKATSSASVGGQYEMPQFQQQQHQHASQYQYECEVMEAPPLQQQVVSALPPRPPALSRVQMPPPSIVGSSYNASDATSSAADSDLDELEIDAEAAAIDGSSRGKGVVGGKGAAAAGNNYQAQQLMEAHLHGQGSMPIPVPHPEQAGQLQREKQQHLLLSLMEGCGQQLVRGRVRRDSIDQYSAYGENDPLYQEHLHQYSRMCSGESTAISDIIESSEKTPLCNHTYTQKPLGAALGRTVSV